MNLILNSITKEYTGHRVLDGISFSIVEREVVGLIGKNGSGKTTLLKIIAGLELPDLGSIQLVPKSTTLGYVPQVTAVENDITVRDFIVQDLGLAIEEEYKADIAMSEIGISELSDKALNHLSSGQRTKAFLARLLVNKPDILLLDEPTNHLDIEALVWLENYLKDYNGSVLLISHDRRLLDKLTDRIIELDEGKIKIYGGNYSFYREQKQVEDEAKNREYEEQQRTIKRLERDILEKKERIQKLEKSDRPTRDNDKFASTFFLNRASRKYARVAQALETRLDKLSKVERPKPDLELSTIFKPRKESGNTVIYVKGLTKQLGGRELFSNFDLLVEKGSRTALTGPNGSGKTTLINLILGKAIPDNGKIEVGNDVNIGYLPQEQSEINSPECLLDYLIENVTKEKTTAYKLAKCFFFSSENLRTPVKDLSSGQKSRLALAKIMASGANFIILDEPTNHLDIPARESLERAIISYIGTLLIISHDRYLLDAIPFDKVIELK